MLSPARAALLALVLSLLAAPGALAMSFTLDVEGDLVGAQVLNPLGQLTPENDQGIQNWSLSQPVFVFDDAPLGLVDPEGLATAKINSWTVSLKTDPFVTNNINVTNTSAFTQIFIATVTLPIPAFDYSEVVFSSVGVTATDSDGDGSLLVDIDGGIPFYRGRVDGVTLLPLTPPAVPITTADCSPFASPGCTATSSDGVASMAVPFDTANEIEIILRFSLSPGDSVGITSRFEIVPEPTTGMLLGLGLTGLAATGRRRR